MKTKTIVFLLALLLIVLAGCNNAPPNEDKPQPFSFSESVQSTSESETPAGMESKEVETTPEAVQEVKPELNQFNEEYLKYTAQVAASCQDRDLSENSMVIGTSAIIDTEIDGAVGMNSGIFNNPFIIWGRYKKKWFRYYLPISFQFHHTQMDGAHAGAFLKNLQDEINLLK